MRLPFPRDGGRGCSMGVWSTEPLEQDPPSASPLEDAARAGRRARRRLGQLAPHDDPRRPPGRVRLRPVRDPGAVGPGRRPGRGDARGAALPLSADPVVAVSWAADSRWLACSVADRRRACGPRCGWCAPTAATPGASPATPTSTPSSGPWTRSGHRVVVTFPARRGQAHALLPRRPVDRPARPARRGRPHPRPRHLAGGAVPDRRRRRARPAVLRRRRPARGRAPAAAAARRPPGPPTSPWCVRPPPATPVRSTSTSPPTSACRGAS